MKFGTHSMEARIKSYQVGHGGNITFTAIFQLLQESAYQHAEELGWGYKLLQEKNQLWVLSRMRVDVVKKPHWNERVSIKTCPYSPSGPWAPRDFLILNDKEEVLCKATSHWLLVDKEQMKPLSPASFFGDIKFENPQGFCNLPIGRIKSTQVEPLQSREVYYSHLDQNNHMNNSKYVDFIMDNIENPSEVAGLEIHYLQEAFAGDKLEILKGEDSQENGILFFKRETQNVLAARIFQ